MGKDEVAMNNKEKILWVMYAIGCIGWLISFILNVFSVIPVYPMWIFVVLLWLIVLIDNSTI